MANSIQIRAKKASHYLALGVITYSIISTFLYIKFRTNLEDYITWWIVVFCVMTVILAYTKRGLYNYLINNPYLFSFGKKEGAIPEAIIVPSIQNDTNSEVNDSTKEQVIDNANNSNGFLSNLSDAYEKSLKEHNEKNAERKKLIFEEITKYCFYMSFPDFSRRFSVSLAKSIDTFFEVLLKDFTLSRWTSRSPTFVWQEWMPSMEHSFLHSCSVLMA